MGSPSDSVHKQYSPIQEYLDELTHPFHITSVMSTATCKPNIVASLFTNLEMSHIAIVGGVFRKAADRCDMLLTMGLLQIIRGGIYYLVNGLKDHCKIPSILKR